MSHTTSVPDNEEPTKPRKNKGKGKRRPKARPVPCDAGGHKKIEKLRHPKNIKNTQETKEGEARLRTPLTTRGSLNTWEQEIFCDYFDVSYDADVLCDILDRLKIDMNPPKAQKVYAREWSFGRALPNGITIFKGLRRSSEGAKPDFVRLEFKGDAMQYINHREDGHALNHYDFMKIMYEFGPANVALFHFTVDSVGRCLMKEIQSHARLEAFTTRARGDWRFMDLGNIF